MSILNESSILKKLETLHPTQESIETLSLWCLHHKDSHFLIVESWSKCFKTAPVKQRLPLLYLANDVCQRERQKKLDVFRRSFSAVLKEAMPHFRCDTLRPNAERILDIWRQRTIFDTAFLDLLKSLLHEKAPPPQPNKPPINKEKILTDFKLPKLLIDLEQESTEIANLKRLEAGLQKTPILAQNLQQNLKDKQNGLKIQSEIDKNYENLENYVQNLEKMILNRRKLILSLEQAEIFYETQFDEAKVVQNAYKKFGQGVELVHKELVKILTSDPQVTSPPSTIVKATTVTSRSDDAPSPSPNDDPFAQGVEAVVAACKSTNSDPIDMDIEDDGSKFSSNKSFMTSPSSANNFPPFLNQSVKTSPGAASSAANHWPAPPPPPPGAFFAQTPLPRAPPPFPPMRFLQPPPLAPPTAVTANGKKDSDMRVLSRPQQQPRANFRVTPTRFQRFI